MRFSAPKSDLLATVTNAAKGASKNGVEAVLMHVLLTLSGDELTVTGTDNQIAIRETMKVAGAEDGSVAILADLLTETLSGVQTSKQDTVEVAASESNQVTITSGAAVSYTLHARSAEAFPTIQPLDGSNSMVASGALLREIAKKVQSVASATGGLSTYEEVFVEGTATDLEVCATDSVRLAHLAIPKGSTGLEFLSQFRVLVPVRVLKTIAGLVRPDDKVNVTFTDNEGVFRFRTTELRGRLSDKTFPNFRSILPKSQTTNVIVETSAFLNSLKGVMVTAKDSKNKVFVDFAADKLTISSTSPELGEATREVEAAVTGLAAEKGVRLAFNAKYLSEFLMVADHPTIKWGVTSSSFPSEMGLDVEGAGYRYIVMPITHY